MTKELKPLKQAYTYLVYLEGQETNLFALYQGRAFRSLKRVIDHFKEQGHIRFHDYSDNEKYLQAADGSRYVIYRLKQGVPVNWEAHEQAKREAQLAKDGL